MKYTILQIKAWIDQLNLCVTEGDIYRLLHFRETPFYLELDNDSTLIRVLWDSLDATKEEMLNLTDCDPEHTEGDIKGYAIEALENMITVKIEDWLGYGPGVGTLLDAFGIRWENC